MIYSRLILLLILSVSCYANNVPVFLWGDLAKKFQEGNPFNTITTPEFKTIVNQELTDGQLLVTFVEETLSIEDLSRKNEDGETAFPYLQEHIKRSLYFPSVQNPMEALNELASGEKAKHLKLTENGLSAGIENIEGGELIIKLEDGSEGESRFDLLQRHNDFMEMTVNTLKKRFGAVVACYTAHYPSWTISAAHSRQRRQAEAAAGDYSFDGLRLYVAKFLMSNGSVVTNLGVPTAVSEFNATSMNTTLTFDTAKLTLNFHQEGGYWYFDTVMVSVTSPQPVTELLYPDSEIFALLDFSYRCKQNITFGGFNNTKSYSLMLDDMKIQPFFETTNTTIEFGDSFNCVGFFTAPIWAGLFVTFILLAITFYGIMMMMDIRTMDRFDDPKGKTITINAAE